MTRFMARKRSYAWVGLIALLAACTHDNPIAPDARLTVHGGATAMMLPDTASERGDYAYVVADQPTTPYYTPILTKAYATNGASINIQRLDRGYYHVTFRSPIPWPRPVGFAISMVGPVPGRCGLAGYYLYADVTDLATPFTLHVFVTCVAAANTLWDSPFTLLVVTPRSL